MFDAPPRRRTGRTGRGVSRSLATIVITGLAALVPAIGGASASQDAASTETGLAAAIALLDELDRRRITVAWDEQPLLRVVNELDVIHGVPVSADWESLDRLGADRRTTVTLRAEDTPALAVLEQLAVLVGDEFDRATIESWGGRILLTTDAIAARIVAPAVYDVRDLLAAEARHGDLVGRDPITEPPPGDGDGEGSSGGDGVAGGGGDDGGDADDRDEAGAGAGATGDEASAVLDVPTPPIDRAGPGQRLIRMALEHAAPETWMQFGGESARVTERDGVLLVTSSATTHRLLRRVLESLRQADPRGMTFEAAVVRAPAGLWEQLDRRYEPSQAVFARRLLADPGVTVLWRSRSAVAMGARLRITESVDAGALGLTLAPSILPEDRTVRLAVDLSWTPAGNDEAATLETSVPLATVGGAASIGLPGGTDAEGELFLVVLPRRF